MNFKFTYAILLILALVGGVFFYTRNQPSPADKPAEVKNLWPTPPTALGAFELVRDGATVVSFAKTGDLWNLTAPIQGSCETWQVGAIADSLKDLTYKEKFTADASGARALETLGLAATKTLVKLTDASGKAATLRLGRRSASGALFVAWESTPSEVYLVDASWLERLDKEPVEFRSKDLPRVQSDKLSALSLVSPRQVVELSKDDAGKWVITAPLNARAGGTKLDELVSELSAVKIASFTSLSKTLSSTGLSPAALTLLVSEKVDAPATPAATAPAASRPAPKQVLALEIGNPTSLAKDQYYASLKGSSEVFLISGESFKKLSKPLSDLRDAAVTPAPVNDATRVEVDQAAKEPFEPAHVSLTQTNGQWQIEPLELRGESGAVSGLLSALRDLKATKFVDAAGDLAALGLAPATQTIKVTVPGKAQQEVILVGRPEPQTNLTPVQRQGEPTVYLVSSADVAKLRANLSELREKTLVSIKPEQVSKLVLEREAGKLELESKGAGQWALGADKKAASAKVSSLLADLDSLVAQKWVSATAPEGRALVTLTIQPMAAATTMPAKVEPTRTLQLFKAGEKFLATLSSAGPIWSFEPSSNLVEHLTKTDYLEAPATAPAAPASH